MPKAEFLLFPHVLFLSHSHPSWIMLTPFLQSLRTKTGILLTLLFLAQFTHDWSANPTGDCIRRGDEDTGRGKVM